jgi:hypothetical protein
VIMAPDRLIDRAMESFRCDRAGSLPHVCTAGGTGGLAGYLGSANKGYFTKWADRWAK